MTPTKTNKNMPLLYSNFQRYTTLLFCSKWFFHSREKGVPNGSLADDFCRLLGSVGNYHARLLRGIFILLPRRNYRYEEKRLVCASVLRAAKYYVSISSLSYYEWLGTRILILTRISLSGGTASFFIVAVR